MHVSFYKKLFKQLFKDSLHNKLRYSNIDSMLMIVTPKSLLKELKYILWYELSKCFHWTNDV